MIYHKRTKHLAENTTQETTKKKLIPKKPKKESPKLVYTRTKAWTSAWASFEPENFSFNVVNNDDAILDEDKDNLVVMAAGPARLLR